MNSPQVLNSNSIIIRYPKEMFSEYSANDGAIRVTEDVCLEAQINRILSERKVCMCEVFIYHVNPRGEVGTDKHKLDNFELKFEDEADLTDAALAEKINEVYNPVLIEQSLRMFYEETMYQSFLMKFNNQQDKE